MSPYVKYFKMTKDEYLDFYSKLTVVSLVCLTMALCLIFLLWLRSHDNFCVTKIRVIGCCLALCWLYRH